jgi:hypothetical protein
LQIELSIPPNIYDSIIAHLLPPINPKKEEAGFLLAGHTKIATQVNLDYLEWYPIPPNGFEIQESNYIELTDESRATVIKRAHVTGSALVEFHSHPWQAKPRFSPSDLGGLEEFVPHVMWRLKDRPYAALVVSPSGFDSLVFANNPRTPEALSALRVGDHILQPTGLTLASEASTHDN